MSFGDLLDDITHPVRILHHPGRFLEDLPGGHFVETTLGKTAWDFVNALQNAPGGLMYLATQGPRHPLRVGEQVLESTWQDLRHPLRHPGYTFLDVLGLATMPGAVIGRAGALSQAASRGALASRVGETGDILAKAAREGAIPQELASKELAGMAGKSQEYNRLVNPHTGAINTPGRQMTEALLFGPAREERILWPKGIEAMDDPETLAQHGWWYSKDPTIKAAQKLVDRAYDKLPETSLAPIWRLATEHGPLRTQIQRQQSAERARQIGIKKEAKGEGAALLVKHASRMNEVNWMVLRLIGEGTRPEARLAFHQKMLDEGTLAPKFVAETKATMNVIREAAKHVEPREIVGENGTVRIVNQLKPEYADELGEFISDFRGLSDKRTNMSRLAGVLNEESMVNRAVAPHVLSETGDLPESLTFMKNSLAQLKNNRKKDKEAAELERKIAEYEGGQMNMDSLGDVKKANEYFENHADALDFMTKAELFRIPYAIPKVGGFGPARFIGSKGTYQGRSKPRLPGSYTNPFRAEILKAGGGEQNVARLIAESYTEAHRFVGLAQIYDRIQRIAATHPTADGIPEEWRQLVRLDKVQGSKLNLSQAERAMLAKAKAGTIGSKESIAAGRMFEGIRSFLFPNSKDATAEKLGIDQGAFTSIMEHGEDAGIHGFGWIDKRMLGDLYKKNPLVGLYEYSFIRKALKTTDFINSTIKAMMLYLRPAYVVPNMLGNIALNLIQQGMFAPVHMGANFALWMRMSKDERDLVFGQMGEGSEAARYSSEGRLGGALRQGPQATLEVAGRGIQRGSEWTANQFARLVDKPFRANAWLQEARRAGYSTPSEVRHLLTDPKLEQERLSIANAATDEIVNFERMGPGEEAFLRRLILFYPFTRGASRYTLNFPKEHPLASGAVGVQGELGFQRSEDILGSLPAFAEGLIPLEGLGLPFTHGGEVSNPAAFSIMGEPAHLLAQGLNLATTNPNPDLALSMNMHPLDQALLAMVTGGASSRFAKPFSPLPAIFEQEAFSGIPIVSLIHSLEGKSAIGGPLRSSIYPDDSWKHALSRFGLLGGLTPREFNERLANYRRYLEQPNSYQRV